MKFEAENNPEPTADRAPETASRPRELPDFLQRLREEELRVLDVRPFLAAGQEPFQKIIQAVDRLESAEVLRLEAPFEPLPLYGVLARKGFGHWSRQVSGENENGAAYWEIYLFRGKLLEEEKTEESDGEEPQAGRGGIREIDVRGLEAPEPLEEVLANLESLVYGEVLLVHHERNPLILFDLLGERGYAFRSMQVGDDYWQVRIWRKA